MMPGDGLRVKRVQRLANPLLAVTVGGHATPLARPALVDQAG